MYIMAKFVEKSPTFLSGMVLTIKRVNLHHLGDTSTFQFFSKICALSIVSQKLWDTFLVRKSLLLFVIVTNTE